MTNEVLVGDYLNFQVRRYDTNGNHLGDFWRNDALGQPYTIGVDPSDGSIYVAELKDNPITVGIAKYDKDGNFMYAKQNNGGTTVGRTCNATPSTTICAFYTVRLTVEEDTGDVWMLDSHFTHDTTITSAGPSLPLRRCDAERDPHLRMGCPPAGDDRRHDAAPLRHRRRQR